MAETTPNYRYFVTYSGIRPPVKLVNPIDPSDLYNRNTFIRALYDSADRLIRFEKMVYKDIELRHTYAYHGNDALKEAVIEMAGDVQVLSFDEEGRSQR
jgi:hypothetical protein